MPWVSPCCQGWRETYRVVDWVERVQRDAPGVTTNQVPADDRETGQRAIYSNRQKQYMNG